MNAASPVWLRRGSQGWLVALHVQPGARRTEVQGRHGDALKIRLAAPPVDGKANAELLRFIAARLGVKRAEVVLVSGQSSRQKSVQIPADLSAQAVASMLGDDDGLGALG